jgi:hypothetical protein
MGLVTRLDQLASNAQAPAMATNASFKDTINVQLCGNFSDGFLCALVVDGGGSRDHPQPLGVELSELRDRFLSQSVGKVFMLAMAT